MLTLPCVLAALLAPVVVVEATVAGQPGDPQLGRALAAHAGAAPASQYAQTLERGFAPEYVGATAAEIREARAQVERGCARHTSQPQAAALLLASALERLRRDVGAAGPAGRRATNRLLKRGHLCRAFALQAQYGYRAPQAVAAAKEAIRLLPGEDFQPGTWVEFAFERVELVAEAMRLLQRAAPSRATLVVTADQPSEVYLNGADVGVTPLRLTVYPGRHLVHVRRDGLASRPRVVSLAPAAEVTVDVDVGLEAALQRTGEPSLRYPSAAARNALHVRHGAALASLAHGAAALLYWREGPEVHLALVTAGGELRRADVRREEAGAALDALRGGRAGPGGALDYRAAGPGRVPLVLDSPGHAQRVTLLATAREGELGPGGRERPACVTPCTLYVPPGPVRLAFAGPGLVPGRARLLVDDAGLTARLRAPSAPLATTGKVLMVAGGAVAVGLTVALAALAKASDSLAAALGTRSEVNLGASIAAMYVGSFAILGSGLVLTLTNQPGIKSTRRLAGARARARSRRISLGVVPVGAGAAGFVVGAF